MKKGFRIIDGDGHMQEPMEIWDKYTEPTYKDRAPKVIGHVGKTLLKYAPCEAFPEGKDNPRPESIFADCEARYGEGYRTWWSLPARLQAMTQEGIDIQVGFPTNGSAAVSRDIKDPKLQAALVRAYNNWATDYCRDSKGKVQFISMVTLLDVQESVTEVKRMAGRPEATAVMLPDPGADRHWSNAEFDSLWQVLQDESLAASFHGGGSQERIFKSYQGPLAAVSHAISFPMDAMLGMGTLIYGGVLEKYPNLRCSFLEANAGWLPFWLCRMDDHAVGRQGRFMYGHSVPLKPSEYFKRQCFVACDADEGTLQFAVEYMGGNNLIFNTDYPHPDAPFPGAVDQFLSRPISKEAKRKILWDNSVTLYGERVLAK